METLINIFPVIAVAFSIIMLVVVLFKRFKKVKANCGHKTKLVNKIYAFGSSVKTRIKPNNGKVEYCHECLQNMAIQCGWCDGAIFIGDPITLYSPNNKDYIPQKSAIIYNHNPLTIVGCLRMNCADTGADRAGFWMPPGGVKRVPTAFEMIIGQAKEGNKSPSVNIPDLTKP